MTDSSRPPATAVTPVEDEDPDHDPSSLPVTTGSTQIAGSTPAAASAHTTVPAQGHPLTRDRALVRREDPHPDRPRRVRAGTVALSIALVVAVAGAGYLIAVASAWQDRAETYEQTAASLGRELNDTRAELAGTSAELDAVLTQLGNAQDRIVELADEKAQLGDDRETQRRAVDYQERVNEAAGRVALALDQCVQGQQQMIVYLENAELYDPTDLDTFGQEVEDLCQAASEANIALQRELDR